MSDTLSDLVDQVTDTASRAAPVEICIGAHWTLASLQCDGRIRGGLASTLSGGDDHHHGANPPVRAAGHLLEATASELVALASSDSLLEASVGMAVINALLDVDESRCREVNAADVIAARGAGGNVAVVGHFPFIPDLRDVVETLWVLELNPRDGDLPAQMAPEVLPQADVVALTGTSLLNKTFDDLMSLCRPEAYVVVLGATTPLSPLLFRGGVDAISGTMVLDCDKVRTAVTQGATFRQIPGKRLVTMFRNGV